MQYPSESPDVRPGRRWARRCRSDSYSYRREFLDEGLELKRLMESTYFKRVMEFLLRELKPGYGRPSVGLRLLWQKSSLIHPVAPSTLNRWLRWAAERGHLDRKYDGRGLWYYMPKAEEERWRFWRKMAKDLLVEYLIREYLPPPEPVSVRTRRATSRLPGRRR